MHLLACGRGNGTCDPTPPRTLCEANRDYVLVVDNSASMIPFQDDMSRWMERFVGSFDMSPDNPCTPRISIVAFNGPPIGCRSNSPNPACSQRAPYPEWVDILVDEPTAESAILLQRIGSRRRAGHMTCISCALEVGAGLLREHRRSGALPGLLILMTDGRQTAGGTDRTAIYR